MTEEEAQKALDELWKEYEPHFRCENCKRYERAEEWCKFLKREVPPHQSCEEFWCIDGKEEEFFAKAQPYYDILGKPPDDDGASEI